MLAREKTFVIDLLSSPAVIHFSLSRLILTAIIQLEQLATVINTLLCSVFLRLKRLANEWD
ncbi:MAG: hypothetical protein ACJAYB_000620 [Psychromonas sp.]|jgi:hypothetical protein